MNKAVTSTSENDIADSNKINFIINDTQISISRVDAGGHDRMPTLLNFLRNQQNLTGSKEGCNEGDCGACTVIIASLENDRLRFKPMNSCIMFLGALHGKAVLTVEYLSNENELHPIQREFADKSASQCGFCTPGFVMSAAAARFDDKSDNHSDNHCNIIAGNLCRCTGYGPILKAMQSADSKPEPEWMNARFATLKKQLQILQRSNSTETRMLHSNNAITYIPQTADALATLYAENPDAVLIAGSTDIGLWANKKLQQWDITIHINQIDELAKIEKNQNCYEDGYQFGANISVQDFMLHLIRDYPMLESYLNRFASTPIRQAATLCGNIANGSPIGDLPPLLIAMQASVHLRHHDKTRIIALQDFFISYGKQDRKQGEFVSHISVPQIPADYLRAYKISKRFEQDISAISMGINMSVNDGVINDAIICYGGMAGIPKRAKLAEDYLNGKILRFEVMQAAAEYIAQDFTPLSDMRASAAYRLQVAQQLLTRYYYDVSNHNNNQGWQDWQDWQNLHGDLPFLPENKDIITFPETEHNYVGKPIIHDSAEMQVSGKADYTDDLPVLNNTLHIALVKSPIAHGTISNINVPDDMLTITADDIHGKNTLNPVWGDDPIFSDKLVEYVGQPILGVLAKSHDSARHLAKQVSVTCTEKPAILTIDDAMTQKSYISKPVQLQRGDAEKAFATCDEILQGEFDVGGQEHFYLEGQIAYAVPQDDGEMLVYSSTQHPSEIQHVVAGALAIPYNKVRVIVRRMGGGFGGKESQANLAAVAASLAAVKYDCPVKLRFDRDDDMMITGKRHNFKINYQVGFSNDGLIKAMKVTHQVQCGFSYDLSLPVADRAISHADNAYFIEHFDLTSYRLKTNTVSNTAFRGFGGPQGMIGMERIIEHIAHHLGKDATDLRLLNLYDAKGKTEERATTPYNMVVEDNILHDMIPALLKSADYQQRCQEIKAFNKHSPTIKRGIALNPVKFGISFTLSFLNQAGALVNIYQDGSVKINHGGTEMGQGLMVKCALVAAQILQTPLENIHISATDTDKVPNTSATAASSGSDLNGMAIKAACDILVARLNDYLSDTYNVSKQDIIWHQGKITCGTQIFTFAELIKQAYMAKISLSATGYYSTPKIKWDNEKFSGRPYFYFSYGVSISEVAIDILTGELRNIRCDILHDVGHSLNPAIDLGQIEGGYIQGMGWLTSEQLVFDDKGNLRTHAPSTYKIPTAFDRPHQMNIALYPEGNKEQTIYRSKAVGEPPLMLAFSNFFAIQNAIASIADDADSGADGRVFPDLQAPATPEHILNAINLVRATMKKGTSISA